LTVVSGEREVTRASNSVDNALRLILLLRERREVRLTDVASELGVAAPSTRGTLAMLARSCAAQ
jgi:Mn-dependent DtxR family transcriptional regulator